MLATAEAAYSRPFRDGLRPDPVQSVSDWSDRHRVLPQKASAEPGRWRTSRTPYLREIMDDMSTHSPVVEVVFMKGAQIGGTECILNAIGYFIDQAPGPLMTVQPTVELAKRYSRQRLEPLLSDTPELRGKVADAKARDSGNTMLSKEFPGGVCIVTGANSAVGLRSMPARYLLLDEVDGYPVNVDEEGDPIALAEARQRTFARKKRMKVSTPTVAGRSRIEDAYEHSDRRRYHVPCPHCGEMQPLIFQQLKWSQFNLSPREAVYVCRSCEERIPEHHKTWMLENGAWVAENPGADPSVHGYHLSSLYSPVGWLSWGEIAEMWVEAQSDTEKLRVFVNTVLGETFHDRGDAPDWKALYDRREAYEIGSVAAGICVLTCGVDVQKDRLIYEVVGWGRGKESWSVEADVIAGDPIMPETWKRLDELLNREFLHASGIPMRIAMLAVDANTWTSLVLPWARKYPMSRVMAVRTQPRQNVMVEAPRKIDVTVRGKKLNRGYKYWPIGAHLVKSELYSALRLEKPADGEDFSPGYCHFPQYGETYFKEITAEQLVAHKNRAGFLKLEWELISGRENHYLDCRVYARTAAAVIGIDRWRNDEWDRIGSSVGAAKVVETDDTTGNGKSGHEPKQTKRRRSGWLGDRRGWLNRKG